MSLISLWTTSIATTTTVATSPAKTWTFESGVLGLILFRICFPFEDFFEVLVLNFYYSTFNTRRKICTFGSRLVESMTTLESVVAQDFFDANTNVFNNFWIWSGSMPDWNHVVVKFERKYKPEDFTTFNQFKLLTHKPKKKFFPVLGSVRLWQFYCPSTAIFACLIFPERLYAIDKLSNIIKVRYLQSAKMCRLASLMAFSSAIKHARILLPLKS